MDLKTLLAYLNDTIRFILRSWMTWHKSIFPETEYYYFKLLMLINLMTVTYR